jgi:hypothetical protein
MVQETLLKVMILFIIQMSTKIFPLEIYNPS